MLSQKRWFLFNSRIVRTHFAFLLVFEATTTTATKTSFKIELQSSLTVLRSFPVGHVVTNKRNVLSLEWNERFYLKEESGRFSTVGSRCRQNLKFENFTSLLHQKIAPKSMPHSQQPIMFLFCDVVSALLSSFLKLSFNSLLTFYEPFPLPQNVIIIQITHVYYSSYLI